MLALSLFIAVVSTLGRMYRDSEMTIWFASGVGLSRFVRPVLVTSWPVLLVIALLVLVVWPWGNRQSAELRERYQQRSDLSRVAPGMFQVSRDGSRVFFVERDADNDATRARNVFVLSNDARRETVVAAHSGHIENEEQRRVLVLQDGQRNETNRETGELALSRFDSYRVTVDEQEVGNPQERSPKTQRTIDLLRQPGARQQAELCWRFGLLLGAGNLMLLGIGLSAANPRRASNWNLLFALLGFVVYYNFINLTQAWVGSGRTSLAGALLGLHGGAAALALALLWWREQGHTAPMLRLLGKRP
jgi:lipopolysaccharide export system permease protein